MKIRTFNREDDRSGPAFDPHGMHLGNATIPAIITFGDYHPIILPLNQQPAAQLKGL